MKVQLDKVVKCPKSFGAVMYFDVACGDCSLFHGIKVVEGVEYVNCGMEGDVPADLSCIGDMHAARIMLEIGKCPDCDGTVELKRALSDMSKDYVCTVCDNWYNDAAGHVTRRGKVEIDVEGNIIWGN